MCEGDLLKFGRTQLRVKELLRQLQPMPGKPAAAYRKLKRGLKKRLKEKPVSSLDCDEIAWLFTELASVAQQEGILALDEFVEILATDPDDNLVALGLGRAVRGLEAEANLQILEKRSRLLLQETETRHRMIIEGVGLLHKRSLPAWVKHHLRAHYMLESESETQKLKGSSP